LDGLKLSVAKPASKFLLVTLCNYILCMPWSCDFPTCKHEQAKVSATIYLLTFASCHACFCMCFFLALASFLVQASLFSALTSCHLCSCSSSPCRLPLAHDLLTSLCLQSLWKLHAFLFRSMTCASSAVVMKPCMAQMCGTQV
jgi:hypothetical protein